MMNYAQLIVPHAALAAHLFVHCLAMNLDSHNRGLLLVISGPSGVGKTTIVHEVVRMLGGVFSVSATTRPKTNSEVHGRDYYFVSSEAFQQMIEQEELLEYARVFGKHDYGTPREPVERLLGQGELVILDIDVQGAIQVKQAMPEALMVFVLPPSEEELLRRLRSRARDDEDAIKRRFARAKEEIAFARSSGCYDHFVINDNLESAIDQTCQIVNKRRELNGASRRD